ncbi:anhydro-N-acetylmuramic acid kinase [Bacillus thuringiensis]|nr:anhydro-N-acetylmuramic acid kinase [Bacillus thuringiensis]
MHVMYIAGVMSGTSLDGIDVALVHIEGSGVDSKIELIHFTTVPFCNDMKNEIQQALSIETSNVQLICSLNFKLGLCFANAVKEVCKEANFPLRQLDLIGSHGQTIYHQPKQEGNIISSTLQIGEPAVIAYETNTTVISNFRTMDMAAGDKVHHLYHIQKLFYIGIKLKIDYCKILAGLVMLQWFQVNEVMRVLLLLILDQATW